MAKKESTKKNTVKKAENKKTPATKKVTKVTEEQLPKMVEELNEPTVTETVDLEKFKDEKGEYDLTKASETEIKSAINQLNGEDEIIVKKVEVVNGDPAVLDELKSETVVTSEPIVKKEKPVEEKKENKFIEKVGRVFGYLWNGQEMDY